MALVLLNVSSAVAARNGYNGAPLPAAISVQLEARKFVYYASDPLT